MGSPLPDLDREEFLCRLQAASPRPLPAAAGEALFLHYRELRRWNPRLSLVGRGTAAEIVERHYGESLAALPLIPAGSRLLDVGSGAGFPGLVLAAADPSLEVTLVEGRQRKWAFLEAARRAASLSCTCLNARVGEASESALPPSVDVVTLRALKLPPPALTRLARRLSPQGFFLFWSGAAEPALPKGLAVEGRWPLPGARRRLILVRPGQRENATP